MPNFDNESVTEEFESLQVEDRMNENITTLGDALGEVSKPAPAVVYPEHDKLALISDKSQVIGEFVEWLNSTKEIYLAEWLKDPGRLSTSSLGYARTNIQALLAEFFGIDQERLSKEKDAMHNAVALQETVDRLSKESAPEMLRKLMANPFDPTLPDMPNG